MLGDEPPTCQRPNSKLRGLSTRLKLQDGLKRPKVGSLSGKQLDTVAYLASFPFIQVSGKCHIRLSVIDGLLALVLSVWQMPNLVQCNTLPPDSLFKYLANVQLGSVLYLAY